MGRERQCFLPIFRGLCFLRVLRAFRPAALPQACGAQQSLFLGVFFRDRLLNQSLAKIDKSLVFA
jgi:hypothetical protein